MVFQNSTPRLSHQTLTFALSTHLLSSHTLPGCVAHRQPGLSHPPSLSRSELTRFLFYEMLLPGTVPFWQQQNTKVTTSFSVCRTKQPFMTDLELCFQIRPKLNNLAEIIGAANALLLDTRAAPAEQLLKLPFFF